jgi:hypothetical protein
MIGISTRLLLTLLLAATPALAGDDCAVPMSNWQPRDAVMKLAAERGWTLQRIRIDDGCYEVTGRDADGRAIEAKLDPATLEVVEMEFEDDHQEGRQGGADGHDD